MKRTATVKQVRRRYGLEFKERALLRADQDGVALAAKELKLAPSQFYAWRAKARAGSQTSEAQRLNQAEHARLKREVARLEEEVVFLIWRQRTSPSSAAYLTPWQVLRRLPKREDNLKRLIGAAIGELASRGVRFVELRSSVLYLASLQGCTVPEALKRLIVSTTLAAQRRSIRFGPILTVTRGDYSASHLDALLGAHVSLGRPREVVGIDLAGDEEIP